ncbi:MAG: hypothetical protein J0H69_17000 [Burkholderiales bacterium]|nr:hypothetical protein [Burkholderiales bacterium]
MLMRVKHQIDFHAVEPKHEEVHRRLENWARWCFGRGGSTVSPMFRLYRPDQHWERTEAGSPIDGRDAQVVAKTLANLPKQHRAALNWCYVRRGSPSAQCQKLGCTMAGLALYVRDGRQMMLNLLPKTTG